MSAEPPVQESAETPASARAGTALFVGVFVTTVLLLLTGYRYVIETPANDRYLFQVAAHTAHALSWIGHHAELEGLGRRDENVQRMRSEIAAWTRGDAEPAPADYAAAGTGPLSAWERFEHRALQTRRGGRGPTGPRVTFVLRPGLDDRIDEAQARASGLEAAGAGPEALAGAKAAIEDLRRQQRDAQKDPALHAKTRAVAFNFIVIPECGAIEVMAIFLAACLAFPTQLWRRAVGILAGVPIMYLVNIFRLSCLAVIGALDRGGAYFSFAHEYVWQAVYIVFVVIVWLAWVEYVVRIRGRGDEAEEEPAEAAPAGPAHGRLLEPLRRAWDRVAHHRRSISLFAVRFVLFVVPLTLLWWWVLPVYGYLLAQATGMTLRFLLGMPIEYVRLDAHGLLNTESLLVFGLEGREPRMPIALLVTNVAPYLALVAATAGLAWRRRLRILGVGVGILVLGHYLFIVLALRFDEAVQRASEIPTAMVQFYLTLPFLLWIVFAYLDRLLGRPKKRR